jgi:hypothetical protein
MFRIGGIGTTLLGVSAMDRDNVAIATHWFTFIYLPIIPLGRRRVRFFPHQGSGFSYELLSHEPLSIKEVLRTYFNGWILTPVLLLSPLVLAFREVWFILGLPASWQIPYLVIALLWLVGSAWIALDRHEAKYRPPPMPED